MICRSLRVDVQSCDFGLATHLHLRKKRGVRMDQSPHRIKVGRSNQQKVRLIYLVYALPVLCVRPPSTTISVPVMYEASLLAKNKAALATSHAVPILPVGTC